MAGMLRRRPAADTSVCLCRAEELCVRPLRAVGAEVQTGTVSLPKSGPPKGAAPLLKFASGNMLSAKQRP